MAGPKIVHEVGFQGGAGGFAARDNLGTGEFSTDKAIWLTTPTLQDHLDDTSIHFTQEAMANNILVFAGETVTFNNNVVLV